MKEGDFIPLQSLMHNVALNWFSLVYLEFEVAFMASIP